MVVESAARSSVQWVCMVRCLQYVKYNVVVIANVKKGTPR